MDMLIEMIVLGLKIVLGLIVLGFSYSSIKEAISFTRKAK